MLLTLYFVFTLLFWSIPKVVCFLKERSRLDKFRPFSNIAFMQIPEDISYDDKISVLNIGNSNFLNPNTDIHPIDGT